MTSDAQCDHCHLPAVTSADIEFAASVRTRLLCENGAQAVLTATMGDDPVWLSVRFTPLGVAALVRALKASEGDVTAPGYSS